MIKAYRPPSHVSGYFDTDGGVIAVYTKQGEYAVSLSARHNFIVPGYNRLEGLWK
jgi:hypothetical protein